ncbi:hypothetical protein ACVDG3_18340 [Meridianimarinicoccus sp. RP-17]|uniref:hypothetical protein n=1 Tax=Meridianimarinicoccus zhengii TaxID=2056810 RepID=UPI000DAC35E3|nr:hypothetical protein [Phycocomes zhengii]
MHRKTARRIAQSALVALSLSGCARELQTQDAVTPTLGNAVRANATIHAVRLPERVVDDTSLNSDGTVAAGALDRYRNVEED